MKQKGFKENSLEQKSSYVRASESVLHKYFKFSKVFGLSAFGVTFLGGAAFAIIFNNPVPAFLGIAGGVSGLFTAGIGAVGERFSRKKQPDIDPDTFR